MNGLMSPCGVQNRSNEIKSSSGRGYGKCYMARNSNPKITGCRDQGAERQLDSPDLRERARESRALAALNHSNIVDIYDSGEFQGAPYIVMEYIRGETVAEKIKRRAPLTISEKLKMMTELCAGLAHAHEAGIVHRDIKPANLMVDQRRCLKILDFGIARVDEGSMTRASVQVTQFNMRIGTPGYMSPEQIEGDEIDRRSDIFAVGAVLYELLCYREAFSGSSTRQIENKVLQAAPPARVVLPRSRPRDCAIVRRRWREGSQSAFRTQSHSSRRWSINAGGGAGCAHTSAVRSTPPRRRHPPRRGSATPRRAGYQRSLAVYQDGAVDAASRFAIEASRKIQTPRRARMRRRSSQQLERHVCILDRPPSPSMNLGQLGWLHDATVVRTSARPMGKARAILAQAVRTAPPLARSALFLPAAAAPDCSSSVVGCSIFVCVSTRRPG